MTPQPHPTPRRQLFQHAPCWLSLLVATLGLIATGCGSDTSKSADKPKATHERPQDEATVLAMKAERQRLDATVWLKESIAQQYEAVIVKLWDDLRAATNKYSVLASFPFDTIRIPAQSAVRRLDWGIVELKHDTRGEPLDRQAALAMLNAIKAEGFEIVESEWHHAAFDVREDGRAQSTVTFLLHVLKPAHNVRLSIRGELHVEWLARTKDSDPIRATGIDVASFTIGLRQGSSAFPEVLTYKPNPDSLRPDDLEPVILYDINKDGKTDILFPGANRMHLNLGPGKFKSEFMYNDVAPIVHAAVVADFDGDALPDMLTAGRGTHLFFYPGESAGRFGSPRIASEIESPLIAPLVITVGDIDSDGDLDAWVTQYKPPYALGQMPTPFYDANDGFPSFLLINDGRGHFADATTPSGLAKKRFRRSYSSSFVDLDDDQDLDLIVVSDFAGIDVYLNDGKGHFTDATVDLLGTGNNTFGMSHSISDFNGDGALDVLIVGMSSTTARRLDAMGIGRDEFEAFQKMRPLMGYGNRLYMGRAGGFDVAPFNDSIARTGWSWGSTAIDFDNDGDLDIYIGNGHSSGASSKDYCTRFWCHDIYAVGSEMNAARDALFVDSLNDLNSGKESWNGYEHNALLMNEGGSNFVNVGFLLGAAFEYDSRAVASSDFDGDGRKDLVVVSIGARPKMADTTHVYRNTLQTTNNWIGIRLNEEGAGFSPVGAKITLHTASRTNTTHLVTGDSHRAQHANVASFGLGSSDRVERVLVKWLNGHVVTLENPAINTYHLIRPNK